MRNSVTGWTPRRVLAAVGVTAAIIFPAAAGALGLNSHTRFDGAADSGQTAHASHHGGAHDHANQDGAGVNHLPAVNRNVDLVSKLRLTGELGRVSDVSAHNGFAYLGAY